MFWRSAVEKGAIRRFEQDFLGVGMSQRQATAHARGLVSEVKAELKARKWDPAFDKLGERWVQDAEFMAPRLAAGLNYEDVSVFWNRPLLIVYGDMKVIERVIVVLAENAQEVGRNYKEVINEWARNSVRFGTPEPRDGALETANRPQDTMIYPEFLMRVVAWRERTGEAERQRLLERYGTMNAVVRAQIASKLL